MNELFKTNSAVFCMNIMRKLNNQGIDEERIQGVLKELCSFFGFTHGFLYYKSEHDRAFQGTIVTTADVPDEAVLPMEMLIDRKWQRRIEKEMRNNKMIVAADPDQPGFAGYFQALLAVESFVLLPVIDENGILTALVGLCSDEQADHSGEEKRLVLYTVLVIIANHIKVWLSLKQIVRIEKALAAIVDNMGVDIYVNDFYTHEVLYVNRSMAVPYGGPEAMVGYKCWQVLYNDKSGQCEYCPQKKLIDQDGRPTKIYSWNYERPFDKSWFRVLSTAFRWGDGRLAHIVSSIDITENIRNEELIHMIAQRDTLTGIANRRKLYADCEIMLKQCSKSSKAAYVLFFDLNKFKQVNDLYGHRAGDELLSQIGEFLLHETTFGDCTYRYGGDEFIVLLQDCSREQVLQAAEQIRERFYRPWHLSCCDAVCHASIGIAVYEPASGLDVDAMIQRADMAMYEAKQTDGREIVFC